MTTGLTAILLICGAVASAAQADDAGTILAEARAFCESFENGTFSADDAVSQADLDGDGDFDMLIDESRFHCSSAASMYCGSGGCMLHAVIDGRNWSFQAEGWRLIAWDDRPILLVARDGGWCGGVGAQLCFEAVVWSDGEALTVMPPLD